MPRKKRTAKSDAAKDAVVGKIEQAPDSTADLRNVELTASELPVVREGLRLLDRRLEKLLKQKMPAAIREEVEYWRNLATGRLAKLVDEELPKGKSLKLEALDRTSRLIIRGAIDVYTTNERAIVPMLQGLGKNELAETLTAEASRWESDTRPKVVERDQGDLFDDPESDDNQEDEDE